MEKTPQSKGMKHVPQILTLCLLLTSSLGQGQGVLVLDQYSWLDETPFPGTGSVMQNADPLGQSFTPTLSSVDFVRFKFADADSLQANGATVHVDLLSGSITGTLLGSTAPVFMPDGFAGVATFLFPASQPLTPGTTYYFSVILHAGSDAWAIDSGGYNYPGGMSYWQGAAVGGDLWFQEGIVVPEPSLVTLFLLGGAGLAAARSRHRRQ